MQIFLSVSFLLCLCCHPFSIHYTYIELFYSTLYVYKMAVDGKYNSKMKFKINLLIY